MINKIIARTNLNQSLLQLGDSLLEISLCLVRNATDGFPAAPVEHTTVYK